MASTRRHRLVSSGIDSGGGGSTRETALARHVGVSSTTSFDVSVQLFGGTGPAQALDALEWGVTGLAGARSALE